ncbi:MAG: hypothetical protein ACFFG0_38225 [Candidatus Thorarchaeota archaeon]
MKKMLVLLIGFMLVMSMGLVMAKKGGKFKECTTIQSGELVASTGEIL